MLLCRLHEIAFGFSSYASDLLNAKGQKGLCRFVVLVVERFPELLQARFADPNILWITDKGFVSWRRAQNKRARSS